MEYVEFTRVMTELGSFYLDFELTEQQNKVWFRFFKDMSVKQFQSLCVIYMNTETYAPRNPMMIKKCYEKQVKEKAQDKRLTEEEAWNLIRRGISHASPNYQLNNYLEFIRKNDKVVAEVAETMIGDIKNLNEDNRSFVGHRFKEAYKTLLKRKTNNKYQELVGCNISKLLDQKANKLLEDKEEKVERTDTEILALLEEKEHNE